jgi:hypothetical protein
MFHFETSCCILDG